MHAFREGCRWGLHAPSAFQDRFIGERNRAHSARPGARALAGRRRASRQQPLSSHRRATALVRHERASALALALRTACGASARGGLQHRCSLFLLSSPLSLDTERRAHHADANIPDRSPAGRDAGTDAPGEHQWPTSECGSACGCVPGPNDPDTGACAGGSRGAAAGCSVSGSAAATIRTGRAAPCTAATAAYSIHER